MIVITTRMIVITTRRVSLHQAGLVAAAMVVTTTLRSAPDLEHLWRYPMSTPSMTSDSSEMPSVASGNAAEHLWMHFTRMSSFASKPVPTIERGRGRVHLGHERSKVS
jgi:hypothetical protein